MLKTLSCLLAVLLGAALVNGAEVPKKKVLVVMIDGMRADAFAAFKPTTLTKLMKGEWKPGYKGAWTLCARTIPDAPAHSAPNHAAIATGVTAAKHKVTRNGTTKQGNWKEWPSWLHRLKKAQPEKKALYIHAWSESGYIDPTPLVTRIGKSDWANTTVYPKLITEKDCPDAIMYYINAPDGGGHGTGFYPYGDNYSQTIQLADRYLTLMLDLISKRPSFSAEDWLILVTADHGGYARGHGQPGGQSDTVPLIMAGKNIVSGKLAGTPSVTDLPVTALEFMGVSTAGMNLDGKVIGNKLSSEKPGKSLAEGLEAYMIFSRRPIPANRAKLAIRSAQVGLGVSSASRRYMLFGNTLSCEDVKLKNAKFIPHGMVFHGLEKLKMSNNHCFTLTFWVRLPAKQPGDSVIIGNKHQSEDSKTGFYISAARKTVNGAKGPGVVLNSTAGTFMRSRSLLTMLCISSRAAGTDISTGLWKNVPAPSTAAIPGIFPSLKRAATKPIYLPSSTIWLSGTEISLLTRSARFLKQAAMVLLWKISSSKNTTLVPGKTPGTFCLKEKYYGQTRYFMET